MGRQGGKRRTDRRKTDRGRKRTQRGGSMPWLVDFKKGYTVTRDMIKAVKKPINVKKAKREVSGYKREYQQYKRRGGGKSYSSWAVDKGYAQKPTCCIQ